MSASRDRLHLLTMRDSARTALELVAGRNRADLESDIAIQYALAYVVEKLGRAADAVSPDFRARHTQVEWGKLLRLQKAHCLGDWHVEPDVVWNMIHEVFPKLIDELESLSEVIAKQAPAPREVNLAVLPLEEIRAWCETQPISQLSIFGSALYDELTPDSDIDLLVEYLPDAKVGLFDMSNHAEALGETVGRRVDLGTFGSLSPYIRDEVISSAQSLYTREPSP